MEEKSQDKPKSDPGDQLPAEGFSVSPESPGSFSLDKKAEINGLNFSSLHPPLNFLAPGMHLEFKMVGSEESIKTSLNL